MCSGHTIRRMKDSKKDDSSALIPDGTCLHEPDAIHRVVVQFANASEAKRFFEYVKCLHGGPVQVLSDGGNA